MGRHSASYLARRQRVVHPPAASAAAYVGRVGGLALALGIGVAMAGGAGIARADGGADTAAAQSAPNPSSAETPGRTVAKPLSGTVAKPPSGTVAKSPSGTVAPSTDTADVDPAEATGGTGGHDAASKAPDSNVPTMQLGNGRDASTTADRPTDTTGAGSLPELIAAIPQQIAAALSRGPVESPNEPPRGIAHSSEASSTRQPDPTENRSASDTSSESTVARASFAPATAHTAVVGAVDAQPVQLAAAAPSSPAATTKTVVLEAVAPARAAPANPIAMVVANVLNALGIPQAAGTGGTPATPFPLVQAFLQLVHREIERFTLCLSQIWPAPTPVVIPTNPVPSVAGGIPTRTDDVATAYGEIGKWMLEPGGQISDYGGLPYEGRTVLEPVNVIIVDPTSTSAAESAWKLNNAMFWSGFPAQPIHSGGFQGTIDDLTYGQQPTGPLLGYSDNFFLFTNNHGRIFGPDPVETSTGYVWSGAFSTEAFVIYDFLPRHAYVSSNVARNALAMRLIASGQATYGGMVPLSNRYDDATTTTGDHDGYAVVVILK